jgi:uncharacterized membrane protein YphA (DoxX/SURF4 family)
MAEPEVAPLHERDDLPARNSTTNSETSTRRALVALRLAIGTVWAVNLVFIFDPQNAFFSTFATTASSYTSGSLGGPGFPAFVAAHPEVFSFLIAGVTLYLAVAFLLGVTTRFACVVGTAFAMALLISQWGGTFMIPGGTDVGPMPLYLGIYLALAVGHAERYFSLDALAARRWFGLRHGSFRSRPAISE